MKYFTMNANFTDYPDSTKMCISVYFPGCAFDCEDCHNKKLQDVNYKDESFIPYDSVDELYDIITEYAQRNKTNNISLMGGDPMHENNILTTVQLSNKLLENNFNVMIYTGMSAEPLKSLKVLNFTYLKTGMYSKHLKQESKLTDDSLILGSTNQKIYNDKYELISTDGVFLYNK